MHVLALLESSVLILNIGRIFEHLGGIAGGVFWRSIAPNQTRGFRGNVPSSQRSRPKTDFEPSGLEICADAASIQLIVYPMHWIDPLISFSVCQSVCVSVYRWFSNDYVHDSLPIFTKFCMRLRNVVASSPIVCETNRK